MPNEVYIPPEHHHKSKSVLYSAALLLNIFSIILYQKVLHQLFQSANRKEYSVVFWKEFPALAVFERQHFLFQHQHRILYVLAHIHTLHLSVLYRLSLYLFLILSTSVHTVVYLEVYPLFLNNHVKYLLLFYHKSVDIHISLSFFQN